MKLFRRNSYTYSALEDESEDPIINSYSSKSGGQVGTSAPPVVVLVTGLGAGLLISIWSFGWVATSTLSGVVKFRQAAGIGTLYSGSSSGPQILQNVTMEEHSAIISASQKVYPAVVSITASRQVANFYGQISNQEVSGGSGFIFSSDGLIMTNRHVVSDSTATYKVILSDGRVFDGKIQAIDSYNDLAVVKIQATGLPTVTLGSSDSLQIGQGVLAVGNALGEFKNSVTSGIISAKQRSLSPQDGGGSSEQLTDLIQTDAAINPGNSGGPLVNLEGQVIGINTAIASTSGGSIGVGFAIPIDSVKPVIASVIKSGKIIRPYLGVRYIPITPAYKQLNNLSVDYGVLVSGGQNTGDVAVVPGSPADKAGIKDNDIILSVNNDKITADTSLQRVLEKYQPGDQVTLSVMRDGRTITLKATLGTQG